MVGNVANETMVLLVNVAVKDRDVLMRRQDFKSEGAIFGRPIPLWVQVE